MNNLRGNSRRLITQFLEYLVGGGVYFWAGYVILIVAYRELGWTWWQAKLTGDIIGWTLNYSIQRYWAFAAAGKRLGEMQHASRYLVLNVINLAIDYGIVGGLKAAGISPYIGYFVSAGFFTVWNYLWYKYWVFPETSAKIKKA